MKKIAVGLLALMFATSAFAQTAPPKAAKKPTQARLQAPMGCKLVGTVRGTKIWAGDCVGGAELRGAAPAAEPAPLPPSTAPTDKQ